MAKVDPNSSIGAVRGKIDGWVYRSLNGQTVVSPHRRAKNVQPSAAQAERRERFRAAQAYAAEVMTDPLKRLAYQKLGTERKRPPNALLIANFLTPPTIHAIESGGYDGRAGQLIRVFATDAIEVAGVTVSVRDAVSGETLESGAATADHGIWVYRTAATAAVGARLRIEVSARNRAGAETTQSVG